MHHNYRVFIINSAGAIINRAHLPCLNDDAARERAMHLASYGQAVELWDGPRKIAIESQTAPGDVWLPSRRIASVDIVHDVAVAESVWRSLETPDQCTPYQRFDLLAAWQRHVGKRAGLLPFLVIARDDDNRPLGLLPLALQTTIGVRCATFMGGAHATFNMGLWDREFAASATGADLHALMNMLAARNEADILVLRQQPAYWRELQNPLALLPHEPSAAHCPVRTIERGATEVNLISETVRRRLNRKERNLQAFAGYRYYIASNDADIARLLDWFFRLKPERLAQQKLPNIFAEPGVEQFIREACMTKLPGGSHLIDIHALECDEEVLAIFAGVSNGDRCSMMFNTYTMSRKARCSPGLILIRNMVDHFAAQNYRAFDFGIGSFDYKLVFCKDHEPIFDSFIPLSLRGRLMVGTVSALNGVKRLVKSNSALHRFALNFRNHVLLK